MANTNRKKKKQERKKRLEEHKRKEAELKSRPSYLSNFVNGRYIPRLGTKNPVRSYTPPAAVTTFKRPKNQDFTIEGATGFPDVNISSVAHGKMLALVKACPIEISWMCSVTRDEKGDFNLNDVYVPLQVCGPATTNPTEEGDEAMMIELMEAGKIEELNNLKCWGHSHVNMGVFASGTDQEQTDEFLERFAGTFFVRLIANKRGDLLVNVYLLDQGIILNNPDLNIEDGDYKDWMDWAEAEIEAKVTRAHVVSVTTSTPSGAGLPLANYGGGYYGGLYGTNRADLTEIHDDMGFGGVFQSGGNIDDHTLADMVDTDFDDGYAIFDPNAFNTRGM